MSDNLIYYDQNPNLDKKVVTKFDGAKEYRTNCKKIKGEYFAIDRDCFDIGGVPYRLNSGLIVYDYEKRKMVLVSHELLTGVVGFENGQPKTGKFSRNPFKNCTVYIRDIGNMPCLDEQILIENGYMEDFSTGIWYEAKKASIKSLQTPRNELDHTGKGYNIEDNAQEFEEKIRLFETYQPELTKDVRRYGKMLGDTTFGLEIECSKGFMPENIQYQNGVIVCRDGSLNDEHGKPGPEFVTIPLKGAKGLQTISNISKELSKRTSLSLKCSLHYHLGNLPTSRMYLLSLYRLACKLQNEIFQMFPFYKTNPEGIKQKNYNQKLPMLDIMTMPRGLDKDSFEEYVEDSYRVLFSWLSEGYYPDATYNRKNGNHPVQQKWNRHSRYYWLNFMNTIFSKRNTVEFRLHTPTTNSQKMINWLFICNAIVRYANIHSRRILATKMAITLDDVLNYYGETFGTRGQFLSDYLKAYVQERKERFLKDVMKGDRISEWELSEDKTYTFKYNNVTHLF